MRIPRIEIPAPFIFAIFFCLGLFVQRVFPIPSFRNRVFEIMGVIFAVVSLLVVVLGIWEMSKAKTTIIPFKPKASKLVTEGIFSITRNPLYLSLVILYLGLVQILGSLWPLILLPIVILIMNRYVISWEEEYLESAFGEVYHDYIKRVRRWL